MRWMNIAGGVVLALGLFVLWLVYAIGISGNTDQRPFAYMIIGVGVLILVLSALLKNRQ